MIHEMLNTALAATEMKQQVRPHNSPAQSRTPAHGRIGIGDAPANDVGRLGVRRQREARERRDGDESDASSARHCGHLGADFDASLVRSR